MGVVRVHDERVLAGREPVDAKELPDTLLGPEATGLRAHPGVGWVPASDGSVVECFPAAGVLGVLVAALLWWWGVVFDLWIVVASISQ